MPDLRSKILAGFNGQVVTLSDEHASVRVGAALPNGNRPTAYTWYNLVDRTTYVVLAQITDAPADVLSGAALFADWQDDENRIAVTEENLGDVHARILTFNGQNPEEQP